MPRYLHWYRWRRLHHDFPLNWKKGKESVVERQFRKCRKSGFTHIKIMIYNEVKIDKYNWDEFHEKFRPNLCVPTEVVKLIWRRSLGHKTSFSQWSVLSPSLSLELTSKLVYFTARLGVDIT